jgi:methylthioribose-1-phosphate isomerase
MSDNLQSLIYKRGSLEVLDQLLLPGKKEYIRISDQKEAWGVIRSMQVRGAPLIAIVAVLGLAVEVHNMTFDSVDSAAKFLQDAMVYLRTSRPTAVNLFTATDILREQVDAIVKAETTQAAADVVNAYTMAAEEIWAQDLITNKSIGAHGAQFILSLAGISESTPVDRKLRVLTICNTGSLATAGYGTALGVVRTLHEMGRLEHIYACETRPYNQGARLTAYEIVEDKLPGTLIADSMASALMSTKGVDCVIVGADRVAANGDTANKVGTYQLAIAAKYHNIPFFAAVPTTTLDLTMASGAEIRVEERPDNELTCIFGQRLAAEGISVWNPAFDVTPCSLIRGIITEVGVAEADTSIEDNTDSIIDIPSFLRTRNECTISFPSNGRSAISCIYLEIAARSVEEIRFRN